MKQTMFELRKPTANWRAILASAVPEAWLAGDPPMKYDLRLMQIRQAGARTQLAWPSPGTRACAPSRIYELLFVFLSIQLIGLSLSPAVAALDPYHEHLIIGSGPRAPPPKPSAE
jgi:hypothetical protein